MYEIKRFYKNDVNSLLLHFGNSSFLKTKDEIKDESLDSAAKMYLSSCKRYVSIVKSRYCLK